MMIGLHDADLIYRNENVHESEKMAHHMMVCYLNVDLNEWGMHLENMYTFRSCHTGVTLVGYLWIPNKIDLVWHVHFNSILAYAGSVCLSGLCSHDRASSNARPPGQAAVCGGTNGATPPRTASPVRGSFCQNNIV